MGLRDHQLKVKAKNVMQRLEVVMCDADDFDPEDTDAKTRSGQAKTHASLARKAMKQGSYDLATTAALTAIRIMEGN